METLGKRIAYFRKERGLSQEKVAEYVGVSRQAVTKWENNKSKPSTENLILLAKVYNIKLEELVNVQMEQKDIKREPEHQDEKKNNTFFTKGANVFAALSILCLILYIICGAVTDRLEFETAFLIGIIAIPMQLFIHLYFANATSSGNFSGIAGYDSKIEYNTNEVKLLLIRIDFQIGLVSFVYTTLLFLSTYIKMPQEFIEATKMTDLSGIFILMYIVEFTIAIIYMNFSSQDKIFIHEIDLLRAKNARIPVITFLVLILGVVIEVIWLSITKGIENNSMDGLGLAGYVILISIVLVIGLIFEDSRIGKLDLKKEGYRLGKVFIGTVVAAVVLMVGMFFI